MEKIITAAELAALLQVHVRTVYRLAEKGVLPGNKIGRGWRFREAEILALVSNRRKGNPADTELTASARKATTK